MTPDPHRCPRSGCLCPACGCLMFYSRSTGEHACIDESCLYGHGEAEAAKTLKTIAAAVPPAQPQDTA